MFCPLTCTNFNLYAMKFWKCFPWTEMYRSEKMVCLRKWKNMCSGKHFKNLIVQNGYWRRCFLRSVVMTTCVSHADRGLIWEFPHKNGTILAHTADILLLRTDSYTWDACTVSSTNGHYLSSIVCPDLGKHRIRSFTACI